MNEIWIKVNTDRGLFSDERSVSLRLSNGNDISFFIDTSLLKKSSCGADLLKVTKISESPDGSKTLVLLPTEPLEANSSRWAEVPA